MNGFIVTARYSVAGKSLQDLALPVSPANKSTLRRLGGIMMSMPTTDKVDIAVIDVSNTWLASQPSDGWQFITEANIGQFSAANAFLIVGYPIALMKATLGEIFGPPVMVITGMISGAPTSVSDYEPGLDRFFLYGPKSETLDRKTVESIALPGVSGAAIWQYTPFEGAGMWSPDKCLMLTRPTNMSALATGEWFCRSSTRRCIPRTPLRQRKSGLSSVRRLRPNFKTPHD